MNDYKKFAKFYSEMADIANGLADVEERMKNGEDVEAAYHALLGRLMLKQLEMKEL